MTRRNLLIVLTLTLGLVLFGLNRLYSTQHQASVDEAHRVQEALEQYGQQLAHSIPAKSVAFSHVTHTTDQPLRAYQIQFITSRQDLMAEEISLTETTPSTRNSMRTALWQAKFCTLQLQGLMATLRLNVVSGNLTDLHGETQSMAVCFPAS